MRFVWQAVRDIPHLGLRADDGLSVNDKIATGSALLNRMVPINYGALLDAEMDGSLRRIVADLSLQNVPHHRRASVVRRAIARLLPPGAGPRLVR